MKNALRLIIILSAFTVLAATQQPSPDQHQDKKHHDEVNWRGDQAMGFSHAKTTHHFRLKPDGGVIEVTANDAQDAASRDQIRRHLKHIAKRFSEGDFTAPMFIHAQTPPGVDVMKRLKAEVKYEFAEMETGGRVRITTGNAEAVKAIHEFLRFQIKDHRTGDSEEVSDGSERRANPTPKQSATS
jgi:hypothetical protein